MLVEVLKSRFRLALMVLLMGAAALTACGDDDPSITTPVIDVEQLVARSADTPIAVQGFLIDQDGTTRLCAAVMESYPPQCGEPAVILIGLDLTEIAELDTEQGVTWKESVVMIVERRQDARFAVVSVESDSGD